MAANVTLTPAQLDELREAQRYAALSMAVDRVINWERFQVSRGAFYVRRQFRQERQPEKKPLKTRGQNSYAAYLDRLSVKSWFVWLTKKSASASGTEKNEHAIRI